MYLELDISIYEIIRDDGRWAQAGILIAEGETWDEILDSAEFNWIDQDGGEGGLCSFDGSYMTSSQYDQINEALYVQYLKSIVRFK